MSRGKVAAASLLMLVATACGGPDSGGALEPPEGTAPPAVDDVQTVSIVLTEWMLAVDPVSATAGVVSFDVENQGSRDHMFTVIATDRAADRLPVTSASVVDTGADGVRLRSELDAFPPDTSKNLTLTLDPGPYVLICNLPGHYEQGMRAGIILS